MFPPPIGRIHRIDERGGGGVIGREPRGGSRRRRGEREGVLKRTRDRERKLIRKIDQAIGRVDRDDYGFCDTCGLEIGIRRLEARPTATLCVDCKSLDEIRERQLGR